MSTTIKLNREYFTEEKTQAFLKDHELASQTMEVDTFAKLFHKYNLSFIKDYEEVLTSILDILISWNNDLAGATHKEISTFDSKCIFCEIGKKVDGYQLTYEKPLDYGIKGSIVYKSKIGFRFEIKDGRLTEYGICNAYL